MAITAERNRLSGLARRLVARGVLKPDQAAAAEAAAQHSELPLATYLVKQELLAPAALARIAAEEFSAPLVDLDAMHIDLNLARSVGEKLLRTHRVIPFFRRGGRLYLAVSDPTRAQGLDEIMFNTGFAVEFVVCEEDKLARCLDDVLENLDTDLAGLDDVADVADVKAADFEIEAEPAVDTALAPDQVNDEDAPIVRLVHKLMMLAIRRGASDIHFEPYEGFYRVRMRIDGMLHEIARPPASIAGKLAARLKVIAMLNIAERRLPQDGRIKLRLSRTRAMDFRVSTMPTAWGEKVVLRLLDPASAELGIESLGFEQFQREQFEAALAKPLGMILVTGPTGSGKTLTLYSAVQKLNDEKTNICTAEDPVEIRLAGVNQVQVRPRIGLTFANALRAFLRQDPDVILVGEVRDLETAEIALKAAQTGHLVLSTLHTNDAPKTLGRLRDIGVPAYSIAASVHLILAQRLIRKLCTHCRRPLEIPDETLRAEGFTDAEIEEGVHVFGPVGCPECTSGYRGRTGLFEVMPVTEEMGYAMMAGANDVDIRRIAEQNGVWDLRRSGLAKVRAGITALEELRRVTTD